MSQTSEKIDLSAWFRKKEAAERIGCSEKHVEKLARDGSLEMQMFKRPEGGPRVAVYHPRDVEKLAVERNPNGAHVILAPRFEPVPNSTFDSPADRHPAFLRPFGHISETAETGSLPPSELRFVGYLSITEAMRFTGLPEKTIQKYAREGRIGKIGTKYRRKDLEGL